MARLLLLNGPNLNLLGTREPAIYGAETLESSRGVPRRSRARRAASSLAFQSNAEHELIGRIQRAAAEDRVADLQSRRLHPHQHRAA